MLTKRERILEKIARYFQFKENNTNFKIETLAGLTSFLGMAYILAVNPNILETTGMNSGAVYTSTALAAAIGTFLMAFLANYPFAMAPGMGINAFFAFTVVQKLGYTYEQALTAVLIEGIIFVIFSLTPYRKALVNMMPKNLRSAITVGVGFFVVMIGLTNAGIITSNADSLVTFYTWANQESFSKGITVFLSILGILLTAFLYVKGIRASILIGMLTTWFMGIFCELIGLYVPDPALGLYSLLPDMSHGFAISSPASLFFAFDFSKVFTLEFIIVTFAFLFTDVFDTLGTVLGVCQRVGFVRYDQPLPRARRVFLADAIATTVGACLGTTTTTTYIESSLGALQGGRTGFAAIVTALLFLGALFLSPIFLAIPTFATTPALVIAGYALIQQMRAVELHDPLEGIPAFLCIIGMPFTLSIADGIGFGIISYVFLHLLCGEYKKINPMLAIVTVAYLFKYLLI